MITISEINALKLSLAEYFSKFSVTGKALFSKDYMAVEWLIVSGHIDSAKTLVSLVQIPSEVPGVSAQELATWNEIKAEILDLF